MFNDEQIDIDERIDIIEHSNLLDVEILDTNYMLLIKELYDTEEKYQFIKLHNSTQKRIKELTH